MVLPFLQQCGVRGAVEAALPARSLGSTAAGLQGTGTLFGLLAALLVVAG